MLEQDLIDDIKQLCDTGLETQLSVWLSIDDKSPREEAYVVELLKEKQTRLYELD